MRVPEITRYAAALSYDQERGAARALDWRAYPTSASFAELSSAADVAGALEGALVRGWAAPYLAGYGLARIISEFFRQPDAQFTGGWVQYISMGQILSIPMVLAGIIMMVWAYRHRPQQQNS